MKVIIAFSFLILTSCMTGSLDRSTLPQTGAAGRFDRSYLAGEPKNGLKEISYKRHFTRSVQGREDTVRVMLFVDPYLKLNAKVQAQDEGYERGYTEAQIDEEFQKIYVNNMKAWVNTKTCFDFEINSNTMEAFDSNNWIAQLVSSDGSIHDLKMKFSSEHLSGKGIKWYQFTGVMCTDKRVDPAQGFTVNMTPKYRQDRIITLKWE